MAYVALLAFGAIPVMSLAFLFGGVSLVDVVRTQAAVLLLGVELVALGLVLSGWMRRTTRAAVATYGTILFATIVPLVYALSSGSAPGRILSLALQVSPAAYPVIAVLGPASLTTQSVMIGRVYWAEMLVFHGLVSLVLLFAATRLVRRHRRAHDSTVVALVVLGFLAWLAAAALTNPNP
jgi:hypothetical protein